MVRILLQFRKSHEGSASSIAFHDVRVEQSSCSQEQDSERLDQYLTGLCLNILLNSNISQRISPYNFAISTNP